MKTVALKSLLSAMAKAEERWNTDAAVESDQPLAYEDLTHLRRGDNVTVFQRHFTTVGKTFVKSYTPYRARVTSIREHGWTDLNGFWSCRVDPTDETKEAVQCLTGRGIAEMVPSYIITFKTVDGDSLRYHMSSLSEYRVYRGWSLNIEAAR